MADMTARSAVLPEKWARGLEIVLAAAGAGLLGFLLLQLVWFRFGTDQAILAVIADGLLQGELPFRDRWSMRPPGAYLFYAAGQVLFGKTMMAVRLVEAGALLSLFVAFPIYSRRFTGSAVPGFLGALLATLTHVQLGWWHTGQSESFGGVVLVWAVLFATWRPADRRTQWIAWVAAGALFTFAAMSKPPMGGGFVLCLALVVWDRYRELERPAILGRGGLVEPILAFSAGGAIVVAATLLPFIVSGAITDFVWTYREVVPGYAAVVGKNQAILPGTYRAVRQLLFNFSPYIFPGLVLWALLCGRRRRTAVLYLLAAVLPQLLGVVLQGKFFPYHFGGMVHLMAMWSALGFCELWRRVRRRPVWAALLLLSVVAVHDAVRPEIWQQSGKRWRAFRNRAQRVKIQDRLHTHGFHNAAEMRGVSRWLRANTAPDARVLVWGPQAAIYFQADRQPASRFITNFALRFPWCAEQALEIMRAELKASPPAVIVVARRDSMPWVTGNKLDSAQRLKQIPWLKRLLARRYEEAERFGRLRVYRLRPQR